MSVREAGGASHHLSPLRYPGGKARLAPLVKAVMRESKLLDGVYVEAFAGGAAVGLALLSHGYVRQIILNDLSFPIYCFWTSVFRETDALCALVDSAQLTVDEWERQRKVFRSPMAQTRLSVGFATFYLNRTNNSGVLNGGVIGGRAQKGTYKMDARFNRAELIARIQRLGRQGEAVTLCQEDASTLVGRLGYMDLGKKVMVYLDPPYFEKGSDLYYNFYQPEDHQGLRDAIIAAQGDFHWIVSYDDVAAIGHLYAGYQRIRKRLPYSVRNGRSGEESIFFSPDLKVPSSLTAA